MKEIWKTINGYTDYHISNYGNIKSFNQNKERILKPNDNGYGYLSVFLCLHNKRHKFYIHRLVAQTFIPNTNNKQEVNHKDGNKQNNRVDNLEWCTSSENHKHAFNLGLQSLYGENHTQSKLTENNVLVIHGLCLSGMKQKEIGIIYNISQSHVYNIVNGKRWNHLIGV